MLTLIGKRTEQLLELLASLTIVTLFVWVVVVGRCSLRWLGDQRFALSSLTLAGWVLVNNYIDWRGVAYCALGVAAILLPMLVLWSSFLGLCPMFAV